MKKILASCRFFFGVLALFLSEAGCGLDGDSAPNCPEDKDCSNVIGPVRECGPDPVCGESCGTCPGILSSCVIGFCEYPTCPWARDCFGLECGPDPICNTSCGVCAAGDTCVVGNCVPAGTPAETVEVPTGSFWMGCNAEFDSQCNPGEENENPYHRVNLDAFRIYKYEVTAGEYQGCVDTGVCTAPVTGANYTYGVAGLENHPINGVDWGQASYFCAWVSGRLPTEAEWEMAARGDDGRTYPWGYEPEVSCDLAVVIDAGGEVGGCGTGATLPVGSRPDGASPFGAEDMIGNVAEFVADYYDADYYGVSWVNNPPGPLTGTLRVIRGGDWKQAEPAMLRSSFRASVPETQQTDHHGFRCVVPAK